MMNLERDLVFCYIEEDNIQKAYFRVRPLLTVNGDVQEEAAALWPDEGCLRIVPDRNEQHTFKERMRTLGGYCVMDLLGVPADANKIRTNKNFKPDRGEHNQYILYSDTVRALPEHTFFEVLEGAADDFASLARRAVTPLFYIRSEDTLFGPVRKTSPEAPVPAAEAQGVLYPLACPDGQVRVMLCIQPADEPAKPAPKPEPKPVPPVEPELPIGKPLQILDQKKNFEETLQGLDQPLSKGANLLRQPEQPHTVAAPAPAPVNDKPLTGTPLYHAPMRTSTPQPKNKLQEIVSAQWRVARNEPHTAPLPAGARMHQVENPVETACESMRTAWQVPEAHEQLLSLILSLDGMQAKLEPRMTAAAGGTALQHALKTRLEDMEAERLSVLLQLDKAKADLEGFRRSVADGLSDKAKAEARRLEEENARAADALRHLQDQQSALIAQRDALLQRIDELSGQQLPAALAKALADAQLAAPVNGIPLRLSPISGVKAEAEELITRVMNACSAGGITAERNHAVALLCLLAVSERIGLSCPTPAAAATLAKNISCAMGWQSSFAHQISPEQKPVFSAAPSDSTPAVLLTSLTAYAPLRGISKVILARSTGSMTRNAAYDACSWPVYPLPALPFVPEAAGSQTQPISMSAIAALADAPVSADEVSAVLRDVLSQVAPLHGSVMLELQRFVAASAALMDGGLASACDWAILLWVLPLMERTPRNIAAMKRLLDEFPLAAASLDA